MSPKYIDRFLNNYQCVNAAVVFVFVVFVFVVFNINKLVTELTAAQCFVAQFYDSRGRSDAPSRTGFPYFPLPQLCPNVCPHFGDLSSLKVVSCIK